MSRLRILLLCGFLLGLASFAQAGSMILTDPACDSFTAVSGDNPTLTFSALANGFGTRCFYNNGGPDDPNGVFPFQGLFESPDDGRWITVTVNLPSNNPFTSSQIFCSGGEAFKTCTINTDSSGNAISLTFSGVDDPQILLGFFNYYPPGSFPGIPEGFTLFVQLQNPDPSVCAADAVLCAPWLDKDGNPLTFTATITNVVPEPASLALLMSGGAGLIFKRKKRT